MGDRDVLIKVMKAELHAMPEKLLQASLVQDLELALLILKGGSSGI